MAMFRTLTILLFALIATIGFVPGFDAQQLAFTNAIPLGLPEDTWDYYVPKKNPLSAVKIELGRRLFFDPRLSSDGKISCSSCHKPELAFTDGKPLAEGIEGRVGTRNSPTLFNVTFNAAQFWDGRVNTLEEQAVEPLVNPLEMGNRSYNEVVERLRAIDEYRRDFRSVFSKDLSIEAVGQAIAAYERTLISGDSDFDRYVAGDRSAITDDAKRGLATFRGKGRCSRCHTVSEHRPFFTDFAFHNTGVAANHPEFDWLSRQAAAAAETDQAKAIIDKLSRENGGQELGRILVTYQIFDIGSYRTPSLRNIALTAPYFHDGSAKTLEDVVAFYNRGGKDNFNREWDLGELHLTGLEQRELIAFLKSLTGHEKK
ncbi:MAG: cytochrome-c peroxidase [Acidobacteria bacterium]|nr:cytochrome-c peroxidase [Acidobacteriota bacterium]